mgnify:CR=1 FL=1
MNLMRCPYCGSENIVWDNSTGDIICASCGTVLDKIYNSEAYGGNDDERVYTSKIVYNEFYKKIKRIDKWRKRFMGRRVMVYNGMIIKETSLNALKIIESDERYLILYDIINSIPEFKNKDIRYKLALGLYFIDKKEYKRLKMMLEIREKYIAKILNGMSRKEKEKITNIIKRRLGEIWNFSSSVTNT